MPRPRVFADLGLFVREGFLDADQRRELAQTMAAAAGDPAEVLAGEGGLSTDEDARRAWDVTLPDDLQDLLIDRIEALRPAIEEAFGLRLEPCDGLCALRYRAGGFYGPHRDSADAPDPFGLHRRRVSVVVFVNGPDNLVAPFTGGRLRFYGLFDEVNGEETGVDMEPEGGTLVAFRSEMLHEVTPVEAGERYTLVTWLSG
jgi:SM-20-related protein